MLFSVERNSIYLRPNLTPMKKTLFFAITLMVTQASYSQFKLTEKNPAFSKAIESVLLEFPNNYRNITGPLIDAYAEFEHYASTVVFPGAESCIIGKYHSVRDTTASVQALMFRSENFEDAAKQYKALFRQLKSSEVKMVDGSNLYLNGQLEAPKEEADFIVSTLTFGTIDRRYKEFKVELEMLYKLDEWIINLNMVTRKKDSEVRPDWMASDEPR